MLIMDLYEILDGGELLFINIEVFKSFKILKD